MLLVTLMTVALPLVAPPDAPSHGDAVHFTLVPKGGMAKVGFYRPARRAEGRRSSA